METHPALVAPVPPSAWLPALLCLLRRQLFTLSPDSAFTHLSSSWTKPTPKVSSSSFSGKASSVSRSMAKSSHSVSAFHSGHGGSFSPDHNHSQHQSSLAAAAVAAASALLSGSGKRTPFHSEHQPPSVAPAQIISSNNSQGNGNDASNCQSRHASCIDKAVCIEESKRQPLLLVVGTSTSACWLRRETRHLCLQILASILSPLPRSAGYSTDSAPMQAGIFQKPLSFVRALFPCSQLLPLLHHMDTFPQMYLPTSVSDLSIPSLDSYRLWLSPPLLRSAESISNPVSDAFAA
ncbi:unnamed protein product [Protopolystoma xenopodis]|uniref:Uncharacterized protein n=1 Tax=Protopolystoma xenopodis TaxID=117903 RepID=A0A448WR00_9PLAT|nr:unnamed protein product [Protopolystoma xenopodis]